MNLVVTTDGVKYLNSIIPFSELLVLTRMPGLIKEIQKRVDKSVILEPSIVKTNIRLCLKDTKFIEGSYYVNSSTGHKWKCVSSTGDKALLREITKTTNKVNKRKRTINLLAVDDITQWEVYTSDISNLFKKKEYKDHIYSKIVTTDK